MNKPRLNKDIYFRSQKDYLNNLFSQLKQRKIKHEARYGVSGVGDDLGLIYYANAKAEKDKLDEFERFVWSEYQRCLIERKELER